MAGKKIKAWAAALAAGILLSGAPPAYAYAGESEGGVDAPITEERPGDGEPTPFSVPGNGQIVDSVPEDGTKQFLTVRTKNGNTFFLVLDTSRGIDNAYMLSLVDESDLAGFLDEDNAKEGAETEMLPVLDMEPEEPKSAAEEGTEESEKGTEEPEDAQTEPKSGVNAGVLFVIVLLSAGIAGAYYYFKVLKPKMEDEDAPSENIEFYDELPRMEDERDSLPDDGQQ